MSEVKEFFIGFILVALLLLSAWIFLSYNEAKVFNKITGKNVTTWDAMWADFRIVERPE